MKNLSEEEHIKSKILKELYQCNSMGHTSKKNLKYAKKLGMIMTEAVNKGPDFNISKRELLKNIENIIFP